jgi:hypothetical protein
LFALAGLRAVLDRTQAWLQAEAGTSGLGLSAAFAIMSDISAAVVRQIVSGAPIAVSQDFFHFPRVEPDGYRWVCKKLRTISCLQRLKINAKACQPADCAVSCAPT